MWVYRQTEPQLYTVGYYAPDGKWYTDSDHGFRDEARKQVARLNGGLMRDDLLFLADYVLDQLAMRS